MNTGPILLKVLPNKKAQALNPKPGRWTWISGVAHEGLSLSFPAQPVWIVNHNFGRYPACVKVRTLGGVELDAAVQHVSANQIREPNVKAYLFTPGFPGRGEVYQPTRPELCARRGNQGLR